MTLHNPGSVTVKLKDGVIGHAEFGGDRLQYRYLLSRWWGKQLLERDGETPSSDHYVMFVMMNPSTATAEVDDRTIAKCTRFAKRWGYSGIDICNTFAYRCTDQDRLAETADPVGPENDRWLVKTSRQNDAVVFAYGTPKLPALLDRGLQVVRLLRDETGIQPYVLKLSDKGRPWHPLYIPETTIPQEWNP